MDGTRKNKHGGYNTQGRTAVNCVELKFGFLAQRQVEPGKRNRERGSKHTGTGADVVVLRCSNVIFGSRRGLWGEGKVQS